MKRKTTFAISVAVLFAGFSLTASAQDKMKNQPNPASPSTTKGGSYQISKQQTATSKTLQGTNLEIGSPSTGMNANFTTGARANTSAPKSMEQLRYERKQAAEKGLSTEKYDAAINEILLNQSK